MLKLIELIDSHCHLNLLDIPIQDLGDVIEDAKSVGVQGILCVGVDFETADLAVRIAEQFDNVWASVGLHPHHSAVFEPHIQDYVRLAQHPKIIALGEMGLDYHHEPYDMDLMQERFRRQIAAARQLNKPIIVHTRDARADTLAILESEQASECGGVLHCFTENWEMAQRALQLGFYISFSGIITFPKAEAVANVAKQVPLNRLLIETDAPYLTPVPYRGKPNRPEYVRFVAERVANLKHIDVSLVAEHTTNNFFNLFFKGKKP